MDHLHQTERLVSQEDREHRNAHPAFTVWLTGLSGSGKSSIARRLEEELFAQGVQVACLDGDELRFGLNRGLGFSLEDRAENVRRVAEVARLFNEAGLVVICALVSPIEKDREVARTIIGEARFHEVYVKVSLKTCEARDPHGLYRKAREGEIPLFTGISSPYEIPFAPFLVLENEGRSLGATVSQLKQLLPLGVATP